MGNSNPKYIDTEQKERIDFLLNTRDIVIKGVNDAFKDKKLDNIQRLYELASRISEELGDEEGKKMYETCSKLFNKDKIEEMLENVNICLREINRLIHYEIFNNIKETVRIVDILLNIDETDIAEKIFKRQHAQLNFKLIQYIRKWRLLEKDLCTILPEQTIQVPLDDWKREEKIIKLSIEINIKIISIIIVEAEHTFALDLY